MATGTGQSFSLVAGLIPAWCLCASTRLPLMILRKVVKSSFAGMAEDSLRSAVAEGAMVAVVLLVQSEKNFELRRIYTGEKREEIR